MKQKSLLFIKDILYYLTNSFPVPFCMAVLFGFGATAGILLSILSVLIAPKLNDNKIMPLLISFLILGKNPDVALTSSIICAILLVISSFFFEKLKSFIASPVVSGIALSGALTITVLFTTYYFGIGATGNNVTEMIKSYISLGFHANWRGVLFGTIVLVLMITLPRKFKNVSKYISPAFIALAFTLVLNLFLNPSHMISAVNEIKYDGFSIMKDYFISRTNFIFNFDSIIVGFSLFIVYFYSLVNNDDSNKTDFITSGIANIICSGLIGLPLPYGINKNFKSIISRLIAALIILLTFIGLKDFILRLPVHSCAVVIIVSAWESIKWDKIKISFKKIIFFLCFILSIFNCLLCNMTYGILISSVILGCIFMINRDKKIKTCN